MSSPYLEFEGISKSFPGVQALDDVSFGVGEGRVHALIGENGAGKSTLLKILSGAYSPDSGKIKIAGQNRVFHANAEALDAGIAVIYQELHLVPEMSVAENLYLGCLPNRFGIIDKKTLRRRAIAQLETLGESDIEPETKVGTLSLGQRQMVEIAKALGRGAKVIAFDEPTSSLSRREIERLFSIIKDLKARGCVILYVSHRMEEIFEICDDVTVLRDGRLVETFPNLSRVTPDTLINRMVGRDIRDIFNYTPRPSSGPVLSVENLAGPGLSKPASFSVDRGEILGVFGLIGAGRTELLNLIYGATPKTDGCVKLDDHALTIEKPLDAIRQGIMLCPEDRKKSGIIGIRPVAENLNLSARRTHAYFGCVINRGWETRNATEQVERLEIKTPSLDQLCQNLSGGNQQKTILARWLSEEQINVLLLDEPTRGIDVGARSMIYSIIYSLASQGIAIVMVSSDLPEVMGVADRIMVMRQGTISASFSKQEATPQKVMDCALPASS